MLKENMRPSQINHRPVARVTLTGPAGGGKTYLAESFMETQRRSVEVHFASFSARDLVDPTFEGGCALFQLWDLPGAEISLGFLSPYLNDVEAVFFVFDMTKEHSLKETRPFLELIEENHIAENRIFLVGNHTTEEPPRVMKSEVEAIQKEFRIKNFLEVPFCCGNYEIIQMFTCVIPRRRRRKGASGKNDRGTLNSPQTQYSLSTRDDLEKDCCCSF